MRFGSMILDRIFNSKHVERYFARRVFLCSLGVKIMQFSESAFFSSLLLYYTIDNAIRKICCKRRLDKHILHNNWRIT